MGDDKRGLGDIISTVTIAVLFLVILLLVVFSAGSYQLSTEIQQGNDNGRALLAYVATAVKNNSTGDVEIRDFSGCTGISISDGKSGYEQRIYMKDGRLLEEYAKADREPDPQEAVEIGRTEVFEVRYVRDGLLEVKTDRGSSYVNTVIQ